LSYLSKRVHILRFITFWNDSMFTRLSKHETITYFKVITYMEPFHILRFITFWNDSMFTSPSKSRPVPCLQACQSLDLFTSSDEPISGLIPRFHLSMIHPHLFRLHHATSLARLDCPIASRGLMTMPCPVCVRYKPAIAHWRAWSISRATPIKNASLPVIDSDLLALWCALLRVILPLLFCAYWRPIDTKKPATLYRVRAVRRASYGAMWCLVEVI